MEDSAPPLEIDESELLQACPCCMYSLRGLPTEHRCPECGFEVDRRWQVFGGLTIPEKSRGIVNTTMILTAGSLFLLLIPSLWFASTLSFINPRLEFIWYAIALASPAVILLVLRRSPRHFIAIGPDGVVIYRGRWRIERYGWREVGRARHDLMRKSIIVEAGGCNIRCRFYWFFGTNMIEVDRCVRGLNHYPRSREP